MRTFRVLVGANLVVALASAILLNLDDAGPPFAPAPSLPVRHFPNPKDTLFPHGDMQSGAAVAAWKIQGDAKGALHDGALRFDANGEAEAAYEMVPVNDRVEIYGRIRRTGSVRGSLTVQMKDGNAPRVRLAEGAVERLAPVAGKWEPFRLEARFPVSYYGAQTVLRLRGQGSVWLDDIQVRRLP